MKRYVIDEVEKYWCNKIGSKCLKCKLGKLKVFAFILCDNCGKTPTDFYIYPKLNK